MLFERGVHDAFAAPNSGDGFMKIRSRDLLEIIIISWLLIAALLVPPRYWHHICRWGASISAKLRTGAFQRNVSHIRAIIDQKVINQSPEEIELGRLAAEYYDRLLILKQYWPAGWNPSMRLFGAEKLISALERNSGIILWVNDCAGSRLVTKMALHDAGFAVSHLSRPTHGFIRTEFGASVLNRLWTRIEDRYLDERITIIKENRHAALKTLRQRLKEKRIVSITVGPWARRMAEVSFFSAQMRVPTGPVWLAMEFDAVLLPVFTNRSEDGSFEVRIADAIKLSNTGDGEDTVQGAVQRMAADLRVFVSKYPGQWRGWFGIRPDRILRSRVSSVPE